jgi:prepilin-type processing-associated H-X9-DG protein
MWIGEPDDGYGKDQPGGWAYNILAYIEQQDLRDLGSGHPSRYVDPLNPQRQAELLRLVTTTVPVFNCPTKRPLQLWPYALDPAAPPTVACNLFLCRHDNGCRVLRGDYRVNSGSIEPGSQTGPPVIINPIFYGWSRRSQNGICYQRSLIRLAQITDGTAKTAMIGEKYLNPNRYFNGEDSADDQCVYSGHDNDNFGYTADGLEVFSPRLDREENRNYSFHFGSAHPSGINMAFCDGSIHLIDYEVEGKIWSRYGGRDDETIER